MKTELCEIMTKYGSDKGNVQHNYTVYYHSLFKNLRDDKMNIFELGLGTNNLDIKSNMGINGKPGASLRGWKEYFKNSQVYGADIDHRILFCEERIKTYYCDQKNIEVVKKMWDNDDLKNIMFDIIIEDGLHEFDANFIFLTNSIHKLKLNGIYICEDLLPNTIELFENKMTWLQENFSDFIFEIVRLENKLNNYDDNNLLIVKKIF
jgi:hypothetical protein